jgi:hypothetical protein
MTTADPAASAASAAPAHRTRTLWAAGASTFGATIMLVVGIFQFAEGLIAVVYGSKFFVNTPNYVFTFNATTWGWLHMIIGLSAAVAGGFIFTGNVFARSVGVALAVLSALANFLWLPYYPVWAIVIIALDVFVIWGLTTVDLGEL